MEVQSLLQNLHREVFCSQCEKTFSDPKQLPCLHSFCLHCLNKLQEESECRDLIICPECLKQFKPPASEDLKDLPTNARINSLLGAIAKVKRNASERKCGNCNKNSCWYCLQCATFLCGDCNGFHNKDKAKENHDVTASFQDKDLETLQQAARQLTPVLCFGEIGFMGLPELEDTSGKFMLPWGVAVNEEDEIAITDSGHNRVQVFRSDGSHLITFGSRSGLKCDRNGEFDYPTGIVFDKKGHIIVADSCNHRVQIFSGRGDYLSQFGKEGSLDHELMKPYGLSLDSDGNIIVADTGDKMIKFFTPSGEFIRKIGGDGILDNAHYCVQQGKHFIVSDIDHCIKIFDLKGNYLYKFGKQGEGDGDFKSPRGLLVTQAGQLAVCDSENHRVQVFEQNGKFFTKFGKNGSEIGDLYYPTSLAALSDGKIVIADMYNNRIQIFK